MPAAQLTTWKDALHPVRASLLAPLSVVYRSINRPAERSLATEILADYAADQPHVLADLLMDADDKQFAVIFPKFKEQGERGLPILIGVIDTTLPADMPSSVAKRETLTKRQANVAVALLLMKKTVKVWTLLQHFPCSRVLVYV